MADPQEQPEGEPDGASTPPEKSSPPDPAKKAPAKKAPAKKAPAKKVEPAPPKPADQPLGLAQRIETNGQLDAAKDAAAHAKSTVESANDPVSSGAQAPASRTSPVPLAVALAFSLLAILLVRQLRRR
jgi:hypothetical protein